MLKQSLKLMIPGPIQPDPAVLEAMGSPVPPHYGPAFTDFYNETLSLLRQVIQTSGDIFLMPGSGSAGIDACLGSALLTGEKLLVGINGFFGQRLVAIAESSGLVTVPVNAEWGQPLHSADFAAALDAHPDARAVAVVHLETSTAIANPIAEIGALCRQRGVLFFVDAVSSLGGLPFQMDDWGIDLMASATQKCLGAPPGLAPVAVGPRAWESIDRVSSSNHGWYTNLRVWRHYAEDWADWHPFPITMATNNVMALNTSLQQLLAEGIPTRLERYRGLALRLRQGLRQIGLQPYTPDEMLAPVLTAAYGPAGVPTGKIVTYLEREAGIKISGGLGALKDQIIRIGHMSPTTTEADIDETLAALRAFCEQNQAAP